MSFWSDLGKIAEKGIDGAYNFAQVGWLNDAGDKVTGLNQATLGQGVLTDYKTGQVTQANPQVQTGLIGKGLTALAWVPNKASQGVAAVQLKSEGTSWHDAWAATTSGGADINGVHVANLNAGEALYGSIRNAIRDPASMLQRNEMRGDTEETKNLLHDTRDSWTGKISSGLLDTAVTWYADPTILGGKVARATRVANEVQSAADADKIVQHAQAINAGDAALETGAGRVLSLPNSETGLFSKSLEESGQRMFKMSQAMIGPNAQAVRLQVLKRTPESSPFLGFMDQIDQMDDPAQKLETTINVIGTIQGSEKARAALIAAKPDIARAVMRASMAPEGRDVLDGLNDAFSRLDSLNEANLKNLGDSWYNAAKSFDTPENEAELVQGYGKKLDELHSHLEGLTRIADETPFEFAGLSALDRMKAGFRDHVAQDFYFQDGPSGATVRVMHYSNSQRFHGTIDIENAQRGNQELLDHMSRSTLGTGRNKVQMWTADERRHYSQQFLLAKTKEGRRRIIDDIEDKMVARVAAHYPELELTPQDVRAIIAKKNETKGAGRRYSTAQINDAIAKNRDNVLLTDPTTSVRVSIKKAVYETHIANNAQLHDVNEIDRMVRSTHYTPKLTDRLGQAASQFSNGIDAFNNAWRLAVLARPGLLFRTQIDSQGRALAVMGGTNVFTNSMKGLGHWAGKKLNGEELIQLKATVQDQLKAEDYLEEARRLRASARQHSAVTQLRQGRIEDDLTSASIDDLGKALRGEELDLELPLDAEAIANMSVEAKLSRAARLESQASKLQDMTYMIEKHQLGAKPVTIRTKGGKTVEYNPFPKGDTEKADIANQLYTGEGPSTALLQEQRRAPVDSEEILNDAINHKMRRVYEDSHNYTTHLPKSQFWPAAWVRATDKMRNSAVGKVILDADELGSRDLVKLLMDDKNVDKAWREVRGDNPSKRAWVGRAASIAVNMAPTAEIRRALKEGRPTIKQAQTLFAKEGDAASKLPARMPIEGPEFSFDEFGKKTNVVGDTARKLIHNMSDRPDLAWARHPMFLDRQRFHMQKQVQKYELENPDWTELPPKVMDKMQRVATHRAMADVRQTMYDTAKHTGAMGTMRYVSPFLGAWQDAIESWGRLFYDNPGRAGAFNKVWNIPNRMGLVVDENGNPVRPGGHANQTFIVLPREFNNNFKDSKKFVIRKDALNSIFQGAQWYTPGLGPAIQIPAQELIARTYPELGDSNNPIVKTILPFGTPKLTTGGRGLGNLEFDLTSQVLPSWARAVIGMNDPNDPNNARAFMMSVNQQIIDARQAGKKLPSQSELYANAIKAARSAGFIRALGLGLLGVSGDAQNTANFYKQQYDLFMQQGTVDGQSATDRFVAKFPEAKGLQWSLTRSQTGVQATVKAFNAEKKYADYIQANPKYGWFYVGSANIGGEFSQSVYNAQTSRSVDQSGAPERARRSRQDIVGGSLAEDGWAQYSQIQTTIDAMVKARGLNNYNQKDAADLKQIRTDFIAQLKKENPSWAEDFDNTDSGAIQRFITTVAEPAITDPKLKGRTDMVLLAQYLSARDDALKILKDRGVTNLKDTNKAKDLRAILFDLGSQLSQENFGFQQMWDRVLSHEVPTDEEK